LQGIIDFSSDSDSFGVGSGCSDEDEGPFGFVHCDPFDSFDPQLPVPIAAAPTTAAVPSIAAAIGPITAGAFAAAIGPISLDTFAAATISLDTFAAVPSTTATFAAFPFDQQQLSWLPSPLVAPPLPSPLVAPPLPSPPVAPSLPSPPVAPSLPSPLVAPPLPSPPVAPSLSTGTALVPPESTSSESDDLDDPDYQDELGVAEDIDSDASRRVGRCSPRSPSSTDSFPRCKRHRF
jgi:hypothetical protein